MNIILTESQLQNLLLEVTTTKDGCPDGFYRDCKSKTCVKTPKNTKIVYSSKKYNYLLETKKLINKLKKENLSKNFSDWTRKPSGAGTNPPDFISSIEFPSFFTNDIKIQCKKFRYNSSRINTPIIDYAYIEVETIDGEEVTPAYYVMSKKIYSNLEVYKRIKPYISSYQYFWDSELKITFGFPKFKEFQVIKACLEPITTTTTTITPVVQTTPKLETPNLPEPKELPKENPNKEYAYRTQTILKQNPQTGKYTNQTLRKVAYAERDKETGKWNYLNPPTVVWIDPKTGKELNYKPGTK